MGKLGVAVTVARKAAVGICRLGRFRDTSKKTATCVGKKKPKYLIGKLIAFWGGKGMVCWGLALLSETRKKQVGDL